MTQVDRKGTSTPDRIASEMFARVFQAYQECSDEVQAAIRSMTAIVNSDDASEEERNAAVGTIAEALFPRKHDGELGIDLEDCDRLARDEEKQVLEQLNAEEAGFAERLQSIMEMRELTQADVAKAIGVGQSAISMMLARNCRPQRRTVEKLAEALKVSIEDLWPGMKQD